MEPVLMCMAGDCIDYSFWIHHGWMIAAFIYFAVADMAFLSMWLLWRAMTRGKWGSAVLAAPLLTYLLLLWIGVVVL
jgi:hypothetical protein